MKTKVRSLDKYKRKYKNINTDSKHLDYHCANSRDATWFPYLFFARFSNGRALISNDRHRGRYATRYLSPLSRNIFNRSQRLRT